MAVFQYTAVDKKKGREEHYERGTVVARTEAEARQKLKRLDLDVVRFKKMVGLVAIIKGFTADVR